jgi:hypothetical protein
MWGSLFIMETPFATKEQLKYLTNMPCLWIPCYKLYKNMFVFLCSYIKIYMPIWDEFKKTKPRKAKHKIKKNNFKFII